jgi:HPr kinase/phosphorylase
MNKRTSIKGLFEAKGRVDLQLELVAGHKGLDREIKMADINRPGLTLAGYYEHFSPDRVQIFGMGESSYMKGLDPGERKECYTRFFSFDPLCCVFTHRMEPDDEFKAFADEKKVPVYVTERDTTRFTSLIIHAMDELFAPSISTHATLVDVFGLGVLLMGNSSVGKSECALELIERGHRLVADDMVAIKKIDESLLMGEGVEMLRHHMEIRGIGIINVQDLFGIRSVRNRKRVELVALLEEWQEGKEYERLGLEETHYTILDIAVPYVVVPVRSGRNIPIIIEAAAMNQRLKKMGIYSARELDDKIKNWMTLEKGNG